MASAQRKVARQPKPHHNPTRQESKAEQRKSRPRIHLCALQAVGDGTIATLGPPHETLSEKQNFAKKNEREKGWIHVL
jgi:hypothetical protein